MIVDLEPEHVPGCLEVIRSLPDWFGYPGALEGVERALLTQSGSVAFATEGELAVQGFVSVEPLFPETLEITYLAVHATARRTGIGRSLLAAADEHARRRGATSLSLLTLGPSGNSAAYDQTVAFYRAQGFVRAKELHIEEWGGAPALVMVRGVAGS